MEEVKSLYITSNISVDVVRKDIKNMHLAVYPPTGRVRIAAPLNVNDEAVRLFAISKIRSYLPVPFRIGAIVLQG